MLERLSIQDVRYKTDAYAFVMESLSYTQKRFHRARHVNGRELLEGMKELLINRYGPMALTVLRYWGIRTTDDFGNIVFNLVKNRVLSKSEEDNLDTFRNAYDFYEVFDRGYRKELDKKISRMRSA